MNRNNFSPGTNTGTMDPVLFLLCIAELSLVSFARNIFGAYVSPIILLLVSGSIAYYYLVLNCNNEDIKEPSTYSTKTNTTIKWLQIVAFFGFSSYIILSLTKLWSSYALQMDDVSRSDVIPQIMYLVKRWITGSKPYAPIYWSINVMSPTYLPLQWMPYTIAELLNKDYRWIPALALWAVSLYYFAANRRNIDSGVKNLWQILVPFYPLIVWYVLIKDEPYLFVITVESLIAAYYLFTAESLKRANILLPAMAISICLLSRYSIIFWFPLCIFCYYVSGKTKQALIIATTAFVLFLLIYWLPFLSNDPGSFLRGYAYHTQAAQYDWHFGNYLSNGLGFTAWATWLLPGDSAHQLLIYQGIHMAMCSVTVIACMWYFTKHKNSLPLKQYLLFSLKLYLTVFYLFIQTPYNYLFIVPAIISAAMLTPIGMQKQAKGDVINNGSRS